MAIIGEVGLTGEVRNVAMIEKRIMEAEKMGFKKVMIPLVTYNKLEKKEKYKIEILPVKNILQAITIIVK
jgi:DNA repair protein radA